MSCTRSRGWFMWYEQRITATPRAQSGYLNLYGSQYIDNLFGPYTSRNQPSINLSFFLSIPASILPTVD